MAWQFYCPRHYGLTMNAVNDFVQKQSFVDVKLVCKNKKTVYSHKLILASASPFLKTLIEEMNNFDDMVTLYLPDFDYNIVTLLLTFLYEGVMKMKLEELQEFRELCNGLCMIFPGAEVVKVLSESPDSQSPAIQQVGDVAPHQLANTQRGILTEKSSGVSSRGALCTPAKVPDTASTHNVIASIIPKIEDCEECENFQSTHAVCGTELRNISRMVDFRHIQQTVTENDASQSNTHPDLNLCVGTSSSAPEILQNNETSLMRPIQLMPTSVEQDNFRSDNFVHETSTTQQMVKQSNATTKTFHKGVFIEGKLVPNILASSSVHKKLPEQTDAFSHKMKQLPHLKSSSKPSDTPEHSKRKSDQKSAHPKKRKK